MTTRITPVFFESPADFRRWLQKHYTTATELWVGFHKVGTGTPSMTWPESVDEALCFGWIDGLRKSLDAMNYAIRFTPRKPDSVWSKINVTKVKKLTAEGRMTKEGLAIFNARKAEHDEGYSIRERRPAFSPAQRATFRKAAKAWAFFDAQPAGYKRQMTHWITSAKREETREKRLVALIGWCAQGKRFDAFGRPQVAPSKPKAPIRKQGPSSR